MSSKTIYVLTFLSYALIHSVRTGWSYMKTYMQHEPFNFSTQFLGEIDLVILISLAISLKTIGWIG
jgi:sugar phosphate permease